jgi:hypothetical protein
MKAKEGGSQGKQGSEKPASLSSSAPASSSSAAAAAAAALSHQLPKENISFGNVAVDGKGLNQSKVKKVSTLNVQNARHDHHNYQQPPQYHPNYHNGDKSNPPPPHIMSRRDTIAGEVG